MGHPGGGAPILGARACANAHPSSFVSLAPTRYPPDLDGLLVELRDDDDAASLKGEDGAGAGGGDDVGGIGCDVGGGTGVGGGGGGGSDARSSSCSILAATGEGDRSSLSSLRLELRSPATLSIQRRNLAARRAEKRTRADAARAADCTLTTARRKARRRRHWCRARVRSRSHRPSFYKNIRERQEEKGDGGSMIASVMTCDSVTACD